MRKLVLLSFAGIAALSGGLAWVSTGFASGQGWVSFLGVTLIGAGILAGGWRLVKADSRAAPRALPDWLGWLLLAAALLRLGLGVLWFAALPRWGYGGAVEQAGYVMSDAYERDRAAWELAQSEKPLWSAFPEYRGADQYGGLLFGSALLYRFLGGSSHQPLQIVVLTASFSALAVVFTWAFARQVWDAGIAGAAAWLVALFPDAVLLGSSQMREAFLITLAMAAFWGLARAQRGQRARGIAWMLLPILFCLPLSPLFALMLAGMLLGFALFLDGARWLKNWRLWIVLVGLVLLALGVVWLFGEQILPGGAANPLVLLQRWLKQSARWQAYNSEHASGWMQKIFDSTPAWTHTWLLLAYGVARPFLPAALFDAAAPIWQAINIWRSLGWALFLPLLLAAPFVSIQREGWRSPALGLSLLVWAGILVASFRGGGDQWDNPRYRVAWIGLQAALAGWLWVTQRRERSPWPRRVLIGMGWIILWFVPWYLRRVTPLVWPIQNVFLTLALGLVCALLYWIWEARRK